MAINIDQENNKLLLKSVGIIFVFILTLFFEMSTQAMMLGGLVAYQQKNYSLTFNPFQQSAYLDDVDGQLNVISLLKQVSY